jgi:hypothetical protein
MGYYWDKQPASRVIKTQTLAYTGSGTVVSTNLTPHRYQVRLISQVAGYRSIERQEATARSANRRLPVNSKP